MQDEEISAAPVWYSAPDFREWQDDEDANVRITTLDPIVGYHFDTDPQDGVDLAGPTWPPAFREPEAPEPLQRDEGTMARDANVAFSPDFPMRAPVSLLLDWVDDFEFDKVDIIASAKALDALLHICLHGESGSKPCVVERVAGTVFVGLDDGMDGDVDTYELHGYNRAFLSSYTQGESKHQGLVDPQWIIKYEIDGLKIVVYYEVDAYMEFITEALGMEELTVRGKTYEVARHESLVDIKTRSAGHAVTDEELRASCTDVVNKRLPSLWIRQIKRIIVAFHRKGHFEKIFKEAVHGELEQWEEQNKLGLRRFAGLLRTMTTDVRCSRSDQNYFEVVFEPGEEEDRNDVRLTLMPRSDRNWSLLGPTTRGAWIEAKASMLLD